MSYIKVDLDLLEKIGDFRQCGILSFLLNQSNEIENVKTQKWQQTALAKIFKCDRRAIKRDLDKLQNNGWLTHKESNYKQLRTTEITLSEKALTYKKTQAKEEKVKNTQPSQSNITSNCEHTQRTKLDNKETKGEQKTRAQIYREYIKKQMVNSNK